MVIMLMKIDQNTDIAKAVNHFCLEWGHRNDNGQIAKKGFEKICHLKKRRRKNIYMFILRPQTYFCLSVKEYCPNYYIEHSHIIKRDIFMEF